MERLSQVRECQNIILEVITVTLADNVSSQNISGMLSPVSPRERSAVV